VFKKNKKAYTLVEMMVVMGIMAVLAVVGATAMMGANDDNISEEATQNILTAIREAQTRAISVTPDNASPAHISKAWAVELNLDSAGNSNSYRLDSFYYNGASLSNYPNSALLPLRSGIRVKITRKNSSGATVGTPQTSGQSFIAFATPFARAYTTLGSNMIPGSAPCVWTKSTRPEEDWGVPTACTSSINSSSTDYVLIEVTFKNRVTRNIRVNSNGDSYVVQ
jgi:prepilin-type N-terminal cleavage/methylation domain-containing protein